LIPRDAIGWRTDTLKTWLLTEATGTLEDLKHKKRQVAKQLIPKHLQTNYLFWTDRKAFYSRIFSNKTNDRITQLELKDGRTLEGKDAVEAIHSVMAHTFGQAKDQPEEEIEWVKSMYREHRQTINPNVYHKLMSPPDEKEVWRTIAYTDNGKTGLDGISNDILKMIVKEEEATIGESILLKSIHLLTSQIIATGITPKSLKRVAMRMIPKSHQKRDPESMRPISIIPELSKIVSKLLAKRLLDILTLNPTLLHKSQRGFLRTGNIGQCIDALIDILEDNKQHKRGVHIASYDQRKAYDSVQHYTIRMSLERLNMPDSFVSYTMSSITDSEAFLVTDMGVSKTFPLLTSVKQGDPLAPLIFLFVVDPLHEGLEKNPLKQGQTDGYVMEAGQRVSSIAFADDFTVSSGTWAGLRNMHEWVRAFFKYHNMDFNTDKSFLVCAINKDEKGELKQLPGIDKNNFIPFRVPSEAWRHLGIRLTLDLSWERQKEHMRTAINLFRHNARINRLDIIQTSISAREYLIPRLDIGLTHARFVQDELKLWDKWIRECVLSRSTIMGKRTISKAAFHIISGVPSLQDQRKIRLVSELYIRLASREPPSSHTIESRIQSVKDVRKPETIFPLDQGNLPNNSTHWVMNAIIALSKLNMNIELNTIPWYKHNMIVHEENPFFSVRAWQMPEQDPQRHPLALFRATRETNEPWQVYTDGSTPVLGQGPSGIGIVMNHSDYEPLTVSQPFKASGNNFAAELVAILVALRLTPINHAIQIYTDSQACVWVMKREFTFLSERQWLRTAARPIVRSIWKVLQKRLASTSVEWIPSHTDDGTVHSKGNRLADKLANEAREEAYKRGNELNEFRFNEERVIARISPTKIGSDEKDSKTPSHHIPGDIREEAKRECLRKHMDRWVKKSSGRFAKSNPTDTLELCRVVRAKQNPLLLDFYLQALTDTADTYARRQKISVQNVDHGGRRLLNEKCVFCNATPETLEHIFSCPLTIQKHKVGLRDIEHLVDPLRRLDGSLQWMQHKDTTPSLVSTWKLRLPNTKMNDKELTDMLSKIEGHNKTAGMLGILPPRLHDILFAYKYAMLETPPTDAQMKTMRNAVSELIEQIRDKIIDLAFSIWKEWRAEKKRLLSQHIASDKLTKKQVALENKKQKRLKKQRQATKQPSIRKTSIKPAEMTPTAPAARKYKREYRPRARKQASSLTNRDRSKPRRRPTHRDHSKAKKRRKRASPNGQLFVPQSGDNSVTSLSPNKRDTATPATTTNQTRAPCF
jgi:ribonuclease HI